MPRYELIWLEVAKEQHRSLPAEIRSLVDDRIEQLLDDPTHARGAVYNPVKDQWSIPVAEHGLLFYAVATSPHARVFILRLVVVLS